MWGLFRPCLYLYGLVGGLWRDVMMYVDLYDVL